MVEGCDAAMCTMMWKEYAIDYGCRSMMIVRMLLLLWMKNVVVEKKKDCCEEVVEVRF